MNTCFSFGMSRWFSVCRREPVPSSSFSFASLSPSSTACCCFARQRRHRRRSSTVCVRSRQRSECLKILYDYTCMFKHLRLTVQICRLAQIWTSRGGDRGAVLLPPPRRASAVSRSAPPQAHLRPRLHAHPRLLGRPRGTRARHPAPPTASQDRGLLSSPVDDSQYVMQCLCCRTCD